MKSYVDANFLDLKMKNKNKTETKIVIVTLDFTLQGGIERVVSLLANSFNDSGVDVKVVSLFKKHQYASYRLNPCVELVYMSDSAFTVNGFKAKIISYYSLFSNILKLTIKSEGVILSTLTNISCALGLFKFFNTKLKFIAAEHSQYFAHGSIIRRLRKFFYKKADAVVTLTENDAALFSEFIPDNKLFVINNPVSFACSHSSSLVYKKLVSIGRLVPVKGYLKLVEALVPFFTKYPDWVFHLYGEGELRSALEAKITSLSLESNIILKGFSTNLSADIVNSSIYLCSSETEAFPMSFLEAFSAGIPVVSVDCPVGPKEIINDGYNGLLLGRAHMFTDFSQAFTYLIENTDVYKKMSMNTILSAEKYSISNINQQWLSLFQNTVKNS
jgi:glycosyltransferase involved in cell wall biosynthesis